MKYKLVVDYGKPYEESISTKEDLFKRLKELETMDKENYSYFDIFVYDDKNKDITEEIFKEYEKRKRG